MRSMNCFKCAIIGIYLMYCSSGVVSKDLDEPKLLEQKQWLDAEMEKILEQRKQMELLDKVQCFSLFNVDGFFYFYRHAVKGEK